jgi:hypothetical protein
LECHRLIWHRVVGEYLGEKIGTNDWTVSCREVASVAMTGIRREKWSSWTGKKEEQGTKKSGRRGVDRWRGLRGIVERVAAETRRKAVTTKTETVEAVVDMRAPSPRRTYKTVV